MMSLRPQLLPLQRRRLPVATLVQQGPRRAASAPAHQTHHSPSPLVHALRKGLPMPVRRQLPRSSPRCRALARFLPLAMVNVDFGSPSLVLGAALIGCGVLLLQLRNMQTSMSRDADIVVAAMVSIVGSTLIFQGWRLDPLLLLCQALTTSVAFWYGLEAFRLRGKAEETLQQMQQMQQQQQDTLPPPPESTYDMDDAMRPYYTAQQQQQQPGFMSPPSPSSMPFPSSPYAPPPQQQGYYPWSQQPQQPGAGPAPAPASAPRWGLPAPASTSAGRPFADTIALDYYGNPLQGERGYEYDEQQQQYTAGLGPSNADPYGAETWVGSTAGRGQGDGFMASPSGQQQLEQGYVQQGYPSPAEALPLQQGGQSYWVPGAVAAAAPGAAAVDGWGPGVGGQQGLGVPAVNAEPRGVAPAGLQRGAAGSGAAAGGIFEPVDDWE